MRTLTVLFLFFAVSFCKAQFYEAVYTDRLAHYFGDTSAIYLTTNYPKLIGLRTDSFSIQANFDTLIHAYPAIPEVHTPFGCDSAGPALQGIKIQKSQQFTYFFNRNLDTIRFKHSGILNDSWKFYDFANDSSIYANIYRKDIIQIPNRGLDSVAYISLLMYDFIGGSWLRVTSESDDTIMVSKNYGLLNFKSWLNYPDTSATEKAYKLDVQIPTRREVYDYDVGDIFHYSMSAGSFGPPIYTNVMILNKWYSPQSDTVFYEINTIGESRTVDLTTIPPTVTYYRSQTYDTIHHTHLDEIIMDGVAGEMLYHKGSSGYISNMGPTNLVNHRIAFEGSFGWHYDTINTCYFTSGNQLYYGYGKGIGNTWTYGRHGGVFNPFIDEKLIYYQKGTETWGSPYNVNIGITESEWDHSKLIVYPNPAKDQIRIRGLEESSRIRIIDLHGKILIDQTIRAKELINLSGFSSGVYLVEVQVKGEIFRKKIFKE